MEKLRFRFIKSFYANQQGMVLVFSLLVLIMIGIWGAATLTISTNDYVIADSSTKAMQSYYLAEAGLEEAIAKIKNNNYDYGELNEGLDLNVSDINIDGLMTNIKVNIHSIEQNGNTKILTLESIGQIDNTKKTLYADMEVEYTEGQPFNVSINVNNPELTDLNKHEYNKNNITIDGAQVLEGDLHVNNKWTINRFVYVENNLNVNNNLEVNGDVYVGNNLSSKKLTIDGDVYVGGNFTMKNGCTINGNLYVEGNLQMTNNNHTIKGKVFVGGDLEMSNNDIIESPDGEITDLLFVVGNITLAKSTIEGHVYCQEGEVNITHNQGSIYGNVYCQKPAEVNDYTKDRVAGLVLPFNGWGTSGSLSYELKSWREKYN